MSESKNKVILEWGLDQVDEKYNNRIVAIFDDTTIWDIQAQGNPIKYLYEYRSRDSIGNDSWVKSDLSVCLGDLLYSINTGDFEVPYNLENSLRGLIMKLTTLMKEPLKIRFLFSILRRATECVDCESKAKKREAQYIDVKGPAIGKITTGPYCRECSREKMESRLFGLDEELRDVRE